jgi:DeoR family fructose operon transcriptional repressor
MKQDQRHKYILEQLHSNRTVNVEDIVKQFRVSPMTARRDLNLLESKGYLIRKYGGAVRSEAVENLFSFSKKVDIKQEKKEAICREAATLVQEGDVIFLDCGTTLFRMCQHLIKLQTLTVITNSLPVISQLINYPHIRLNIIGGQIIHERKAVYGPVARDQFGQYHADKAFIGADGISLAHGLSSFDQNESVITRCMAEQADKVFLVCHSSKIENDSYHSFAPASLVDCLVTDKGMDRKSVPKYKRKMKVILS